MLVSCTLAKTQSGWCIVQRLLINEAVNCVDRAIEEIFSEVQTLSRFTLSLQALSVCVLHFPLKQTSQISSKPSYKLLLLIISHAFPACSGLLSLPVHSRTCRAEIAVGAWGIQGFAILTDPSASCSQTGQSSIKSSLIEFSLSWRVLDHRRH